MSTDNDRGTEPQESASAKREEQVASPAQAPGSEGNGFYARGLRLMKGPSALILAAVGLFVLVLSMYMLLAGQGGGRNASLPLQPDVGFDPEDALELNVFYPIEGRLRLEKRLVEKVTGARDISAESIRQLLMGPAEGDPSFVPDAVDLLGVYIGKDSVLYADFTSSLTLNFQGDAVAEFLLLRALYKTLSANSYGVRSYRVLVDGREVDTIGGHIYISEGLERAVPYRLTEEDEISK